MAGFFDGEGCITLVKNRHYHKHGRHKSPEHKIIIVITNAKPEPLYMFKKYFKGGITVYIPKNDRYKDRHIWYCANQQAMNMCRAIRDLVQIKKKQIELAFEFYEGKLISLGQQLSQEELDRREKILQSFRELNANKGKKTPKIFL